MSPVECTHLGFVPLNFYPHDIHREFPKLLKSSLEFLVVSNESKAYISTVFQQKMNDRTKTGAIISALQDLQSFMNYDMKNNSTTFELVLFVEDHLKNTLMERYRNNA